MEPPCSGQPLYSGQLTDKPLDTERLSANSIQNQAPVQNPRHVTKPKSIASTHAQICSRTNATNALIVSIKSATKTLRELACTSHEAACTFLSFKARKFFDYSSLLVHFRCDETRVSTRDLPGCALHLHKDGLGSP